MLDGLDEVADTQQRIEVSRWVKKQIKAFPKAFFIVTSRPAGYRNMPLDELTTTLEVKPFSLSQTKQFIRSWYLQDEIGRRLGKEDEGVRQAACNKAEDLIDRIVARPSLSKLAVNPLLLTMIAMVHCYRGALPGRRVELYDEICDVLLGRRQDAKGIREQLTAAQKKVVLRCLALKLMKRETRGFSLALGESLIKKKVQGISNKVSAVDFLKDIETKSGLLVEREQNIYEFSHKSFQEYLASSEIKAQQKSSLLVEKMSDEWWAETIRLYAAQSDATPLIQAAISSDNVKVLTLAFECLEEKLSVDVTVQTSLEQKLLLGLESSNEEVFRLAAETRLTRRLNKLLRINERVSVDTSCITYAEYQLFVDSQLLRKKHYEPNHWTGHRFPSGMANQPIVGIEASAARAFSQWLSKREGALYRLPYKNEIRTKRKLGLQRGVWTLTSNSLELDLSNVSTELIYSWQSVISSNLNSSIEKNTASQVIDCLSPEKIPHNHIRKVVSYTLSRVKEYKIDMRYVYSLSQISHLDRAVSRNIDLNPYLKAASSSVNLYNNLNKINERSASRELERKQENESIQNLQNKKKQTVVEIDRLEKEILELRNKIRSIEERNKPTTERAPVSNPQLSDHHCRLSGLMNDQEAASARVVRINSDIKQIVKSKDKKEREYRLYIDSPEFDFVYDLEIASSISTFLSINREVSHDLDVSLSRSFSIESAGSHLCLYLVFWGILCNFYARNPSFMEPSSRRRGRHTHRSGEKDCCQNFYKVLDTYTFLLTVNLRRTGDLPAWESIRLAREEAPS